MLADIAVNLTSGQFRHDRQAVIERALAAGVERLLLIGSDPDDSRAAMDLCSLAPGHLFATAGIHPHHADEMADDAMVQIRQLAADDVVVAIGECGLDFNRNYSSRAGQLTCFRAQLQLARQLDMPLLLHLRDAPADFLATVSDCLPEGYPAVVHCFTDNEATLQALLARGFYIGITGWLCDERRGDELRRLVRQIPAERLLVETDAPYLLPRDLSPRPASRRNEPMYLPHILTTLARCRGDDVAELQQQIAANGQRLFNW